MSRETDIAWAAGLWEGEGCWCVVMGKRKTPAIQSTIAMTDRDVIDRFAAIVGFGSVSTKIPKLANRKTVYVWITRGRGRGCELVEMFWPYLGDRRRAKAREVLAIGPAIPSPTCPRGHPYAGDNLKMVKRPLPNGKVYTSRMCMTCRRAGGQKATRKWRTKQDAALAA